MILANNTDCTQLTITSEQNILLAMDNGDADACCITLELSSNCCDPATIIELPVNYTLQLLSPSATAAVDHPTKGWFVDVIIDFTDLNRECIDRVEYINPTTGLLESIPETDWGTLGEFPLYFAIVPPSTTFDHSITIITKCTTISYTLDLTIDYVTQPAPAFGPLNILNQVAIIPSLPAGLTLNAGVLEVDPIVFGNTGTVFPDGIYFASLTLCEADGDVITEADTVFVDCNVQCRVIDRVSKDMCSNLFVLYDALNYSENCTTLTYQQKCDLWYFIGSELDYFTDTPCEDNNDCGCT